MTKYIHKFYINPFATRVSDKLECPSTIDTCKFLKLMAPIIQGQLIWGAICLKSIHSLTFTNVASHLQM